MNLADLGDFIARVGFPVAVAIYLLVRWDPIIRDLNKTITALTIIVAGLNGSDYKKAFRLAGVKNKKGEE